MFIILSLLLPVHGDIFSFVGKALTSYKHMLNSARDHLARAEQAEPTGVVLGPMSAEPVRPVASTEKL